MGRAAEKEQLSRILGEHLNTIHETFQVLDQTPASSLKKITWNEIIEMGEQVHKQATLVGILWTGASPEFKELEENMAAYFNTLQGFLLLSHASTVGAGATLSSCIHASVKKVVDCSYLLLKEAVSSYGSVNKGQKLSIPQLVGTVHDACTALKKTPATDITAIGRAITQVAVSMKDVLREMKELKPGSPDPADESGPHNGDNLCEEEELGNDLSPEELKVAQLATDVVSEILVVVKELIRSITSLLKKEDPEGSSNSVTSLERLLRLCQGIGVQIDEIGACLYPPQEFTAIKVASGKISDMVDEMQVELEKLNGSSEAFLQACSGVRRTLRNLESDLECSTATDLLPKIDDLDLSS